MMADLETKWWRVRPRPADPAKPPPVGPSDRDRPDRGARLTEALLEATTIAGLFALMFALFVLVAAVQSLPS